MARDHLERARDLIALAVDAGATEGERAAAALAAARLISRERLLERVGLKPKEPPEALWVILGPLVVVSENEEAWRFARFAAAGFDPSGLNRAQVTGELDWIPKRVVREVEWLDAKDLRRMRIAGCVRAARSVSVSRAWAETRAR